MKDRGYISKAQYDEAMADDVYSRIAEYNTTGSGSVNTYFIDALIDNVFDDLTAAGYSETEAYKLIYKGGLTIKSTQDLTMQTICDEGGKQSIQLSVRRKVFVPAFLRSKKADGSYKTYTNQTMLSFL